MDSKLTDKALRLIADDLVESYLNDPDFSNAPSRLVDEITDALKAVRDEVRRTSTKV